MGFDVPIMAVAFNRPHLVKGLLDVLRALEPERLYVVIDGPRVNRPEDAAKVAETKALFAGVDWDCELAINAVDANMGVRNRVASGLAWVFAHEVSAIVLEDDCRPLPSFFTFCREMLLKYQNDTRVMSVCGTKAGPFVPDERYSYFFSRYFLPWGWATWHDRWHTLYDGALATLDEPELERYLREALGSWRAAKYWRWLLTRVKDGKNNSWAYSWMVAGYLQHMLHVVPNRNLVTNVGMGAEAVHTKKRPIYAPTQTFAAEFPPKHPPFMLPAKAYDKWLEDYGFSKSLLGRSLWVFNKLVSKC